MIEDKTEPIKYSKALVKTLEQKLKVGNLRAIHLNAVPGNSRSRLDITDLNSLQNNLSSDFIATLTSKQQFNFTIGATYQQLENDDKVERELLNEKVFRKLKNIHIDYKTDYQDHGVNSLGFGYPMLVFRNPKVNKQVVCAPLFIWRVDLNKDPQSISNWTITRNEEHSVLINAQLRSFIESEFDGLKLPPISEEMLADGIIDRDEILEVVNATLSILGVEQQETNGELKALSDKKSLDKITQKDKPWISWSGVLGIYKAQRESIISDLKEIQDNYEEFEMDYRGKTYQKFSTTSITVDPSQERLIHLLSTEKKLIIQGPPGTGKSQSLTAILTNALENKAKCLVVCEKKTALEVLKSNLSELGLGHLCAVIDDVNKDRKYIVDAIREIVDGKTDVASVTINTSNYKSIRNKYEKVKDNLRTKYTNATINVLGDYTWKDAIAETLVNYSIADRSIVQQMGFKNELYFTLQEFDTLTSFIEDADYLYKSIAGLEGTITQLDDSLFKQKYNQAARLKIISFIEEMNTTISTIGNSFDSAEQKYGIDFYEKGVANNWLVYLKSIFSSRLKLMRSTTKELQLKMFSFAKEFDQIIGGKQKEYLFVHYDLIKDYLNECIEILNCLNSNILNYKEYHNWRHFKFSIEKENANKLLDLFINTEVQDWNATFKYWYFNALLMHVEEQIDAEQNQDNQLLHQVQALTEEIKREQAKFIVQQHGEYIKKTLLGKTKQELKLLFNYRKNKVHGAKTSLRKILDKEFELFTAFFPITMVNPVVCSSILPMQAELYDVVIFDEASQMRLEDAFAAMLRGKHKIISGDVHQMPPSSYFSKGGDVLLGEEEEESDVVLAESDSLLTFAQNSAFKFSYLDFHYRSQHPHLIDFSNAAFYGTRLIPMPNVDEYSPITLHQVDGSYKDRSNGDEAQCILEYLKALEEDFRENYLSVGIATFNMEQRNVIWDHIYKECEYSAQFNNKMQRLIADGFFIKNLENIQGDERDIILLSTTFGKNKEGVFRQLFGQLNNIEKGYKLLNVIVTRAKKEMHVFTSFPTEVYSSYAQEIAIAGNNGKAILYAYIAYAKACSERNDEEREQILNTLRNHVPEAKNLVVKHQSKHLFERELSTFITSIYPKDQIEINYKLGGLYIDFMLKDTDGSPIIALECDGKEYHASNESYRYDLHREEILARHGIVTYRIWSTNWWQDVEGEVKKLTHFIASKQEELITILP
ncbi:AAA domain-containing protein [Flammeovirga kamogawensis]|uniref:DUF4011 domain-containing protein n=1 Tax=Flammeovirga kamogawensis TaxID=373891 RepID=A0ABX8H556_9BACT|nr:AAA domain-containing protein [Flammeovirga kamogawensis]MBB6463513.1 very-short-patch-repair endonuclease [Flammeovirga kamogawensis]QWG10572.1 DUF4011 domain-containing protein [Flammeovirga kamogawensis]TRX63678.1 DUF4011 domain-containing protein [Flammeovirga kamogawensis]